MKLGLERVPRAEDPAGAELIILHQSVIIAEEIIFRLIRQVFAFKIDLQVVGDAVFRRRLDQSAVINRSIEIFVDQLIKIVASEICRNSKIPWTFVIPQGEVPNGVGLVEEGGLRVRLAECFLSQSV